MQVLKIHWSTDMVQMFDFAFKQIWLHVLPSQQMYLNFISAMNMRV